jgi:hypothetical protein
LPALLSHRDPGRWTTRQEWSKLLLLRLWFFLAESSGRWELAPEPRQLGGDFEA